VTVNAKSCTFCAKSPYFPSTFAGGLVEGLAVGEGTLASDSGTDETLSSVTFLREFRTSGGVVGAGLAPVEEGEGGGIREDDELYLVAVGVVVDDEGGE
jgi:hypothetical protein